MHFGLNIYFQKLCFSKQIQKLQQEINLNDLIKLWKIVKNLDFYQVEAEAAILYATSFYMVKQPELFMQADQLNELIQIQGYFNPGFYAFFHQDDAVLK